MRFVLVAALLLIGWAAPAAAQIRYPANDIQWRPADPGVAWGPVWGYDRNGDIACPTYDGASCLFDGSLASARNADRTLSCGDQMRALFGHSGYDTPGHWCSELATRYGNRQGFTWQAPAHGVNLYWRVNPASGDVECASDGANCLWWTPSREAAFKMTSVVRCQEGDYVQSGHWCNRLAVERRGNGHHWRVHYRFYFGDPDGDTDVGRPDDPIEDMYFSYSANGDIQCPSHDGRNCFWAKSVAEAHTAKQVLACGADHQAKHGINGYDTPGHWCRTIALAEGNAKGFSYQWGLHGLLNAQDVMCASSDGVNCRWGAPLSMSFKDASPLICGRDHASRYGDVGYDTPGHWCAPFAAPTVRGNSIRIQNTSGLPVRVCKAVPFLASDRNAGYADFQCTDLAVGTDESATATLVRVSPIGVDDAPGFHYRSVCVEVPGAAALFVGPFEGITDTQIGIEASGFRHGEELIILGRSTTCRQALASL